MTDALTGPRLLATKLCPWLRPALRQLDAARARERLGHAWLVAGPAGIGKLNLALVVADRLLHSGRSGEPPELGPTEAAAAMRERHEPYDHPPDLHWLFPKRKDDDKDDKEKAKPKGKEPRTIAVEQVRDTIESLALKSHGGRAKVVIVEPADGLTIAAANALLKTLEEPSDDTYLFLLSLQPQRLPATIRSRCQRLEVAAPPAEVLRQWLGAIEPQRFAALWHAGGGAPLGMAELLSDDDFNKTKDIADNLSLICSDAAEIQSVAATWAKPDSVELVLASLTRLLHREIRTRLVPGGSTSITDPAASVLHNAWTKLTLRQLFGQYDRAEQLLTQLGGGVNMELALQALLVGFQADRERS
jgi:DNA polymerase III subunit delta'